MLFRNRSACKRRASRLIVYCQRPKPKRTRKSVLRTKAKRKEQDRELLDYANKLQKKLENQINRVTGNGASTRKAKTKGAKKTSMGNKTRSSP